MTTTRKIFTVSAGCLTVFNFKVEATSEDQAEELARQNWCMHGMAHWKECPLDEPHFQVEGWEAVA